MTGGTTCGIATWADFTWREGEHLWHAIHGLSDRNNYTTPDHIFHDSAIPTLVSFNIDFIGDGIGIHCFVNAQSLHILLYQKYSIYTSNSMCTSL